MPAKELGTFQNVFSIIYNLDKDMTIYCDPIGSQKKISSKEWKEHKVPISAGSSLKVNIPKSIGLVSYTEKKLVINLNQQADIIAIKDNDTIELNVLLPT